MAMNIMNTVRLCCWPKCIPIKYTLQRTICYTAKRYCVFGPNSRMLQNPICCPHVMLNYRLYSAQVAENEDDLIVTELCGSDKELEQKLRVLMLEVQVMREDGRSAPNKLARHHWKQLLDLPTRSQRTKYLTYLFKTEMAKENEKMRKEKRRQLYEEEKLNPTDTKEYPDDLEYGLKHNGMFLRLSDRSINNYYNYRAALAMVHGQPIVLDCSYDKEMVTREATNAAKQLTLLFGDNRVHKSPYNLFFCNMDSNGTIMDQLLRNIPTANDLEFPINIKKESYLDLFPKERLVYLTPHCREELKQYDHDAVYIIGCMVDKVSNEPLSLARAKRDGIKMARLPLDRYLAWGPGSGKTLNINHMLKILLDLKISGDWEYALRHVPQRKLVKTQLLTNENRLMFKNKKLYHDSDKYLKKNSIHNTPTRREYVYKNLLKEDDRI